MTASCSGEVGVGVSRVQGRVAAPGPRPGHVPFEEVQEGEGKAVVAGGGRYDGVNMGMGPMLLIGVKRAIAMIGSCCVWLGLTSHHVSA